MSGDLMAFREPHRMFEALQGTDRFPPAAPSSPSTRTTGPYTAVHPPLYLNSLADGGTPSFSGRSCLRPIVVGLHRNDVAVGGGDSKLRASDAERVGEAILAVPALESARLNLPPGTGDVDRGDLREFWPTHAGASFGCLESGLTAPSKKCSWLIGALRDGVDQLLGLRSDGRG